MQCKCESFGLKDHVRYKAYDFERLTCISLLGVALMKTDGK